MPIIKSAKKKLRQDAKRTKVNIRYENAYENAIKEVLKNKDNKKEITNLVKKAYSAIDKAVKQRVIHKNKAARLKSKVTKIAK